VTKNELLVLVAGVMGTLAEAPEGCPESTLYLACGMDLGKWQTARRVLVNAGMVEISRECWVTPTLLGIETGVACNSALADARKSVKA